MNQILTKIPDIVQLIALGLMALMLFATFVARIIPGKKDDEFVASIGGKVLKAIQWLPTIGVNPRTKALEDAYGDLKKQLDEIKPNADSPPNP